MISFNKSIEKDFNIYYLITLCGSAILYLLLAGGKYIWSDEAYSLMMIGHNYGEIAEITAGDVHPPLYYFLLKLVTAPFGYNVLFTRVFSVIPFVLIIGIGGIQFKHLFNEKMALLFMWLFFLFPYLIPYSVEIRMYSLAALFVFVNAIYALRCFRENRIINWIWFILCGVAAAYTHYYALVSVGIIYGIFFVVLFKSDRTKYKYWVISVISSILLYIPWLRSFTGQLAYKVSHEYWIEKITLGTIWRYYKTIFGIPKLGGYFLLFSSVYLISLIYIFVKKKNIMISVCMLAVPALTVAVGVLVSVIIRPVFVIRYVTPALPLMIAFVALALSEIEWTWFVAASLCIAILGGGINYVHQFDQKYTFRENELNAEFIADNKCDCYIVLLKDVAPAVVLSYYNGKIPIYRKTKFSNTEHPYHNHYLIEDFDKDSYKNVIVIVEKGEEVPAEYLEGFKEKYLMPIQQNYKYYDTYYLTK